LSYHHDQRNPLHRCTILYLPSAKIDADSGERRGGAHRMANLRESVGRSTTSHNLGMSDWSERDIDRVAALGCAARFSPMGTDLFRWAYAGDPRAAVRVMVHLADEVRRSFRMPVAFVEGVCRQAMTEFTAWACPVCDGRKDVTLGNGVKVVCDSCDGTGLRRYSNGDRRRGAGFGPGVSYARVIEQPLELAIAVLKREDGRVNAIVSLELERVR